MECVFLGNTSFGVRNYNNNNNNNNNKYFILPYVCYFTDIIKERVEIRMGAEYLE